MLSVILVENGANETQARSVLTALKARKGAEIIVVGKTLAGEVTSERFIPTSSTSPAEAIRTAVQITRGDRILFIDARGLASPDTLHDILDQCEESGSTTLFYAPISLGSDSVELQSIHGSRVVSFIADFQAMPALLFSGQRQTIEAALEGNTASTLSMIFARSVIVATKDGDEIVRGSSSIDADSSLEQSLNLTNSDRSELLSLSVNSFNIEDLFPNHAWSDHEKECAAACYHTLAAIFLRLGDIESANECLRLGDNFEDSPRSLALKAIIANTKGETLGAVANLVSSLQQYEARKGELGSTHYISFSPNNLDSVQEQLTAGLDALNKRKNEEAIGCFAKAVYSFDSFYKEHGIDKLLN